MPIASDVTFIADVINNKATIVTSVPSNPNEGMLIMFLGTDPNFVTGGLYKYVSSSWVQLFAVTKADVGLGNCDNTADANKSVLYAQSAGYCSSTTSADITKTLDATNGDKLQIGTGTAVNITNAQHAASADSATTATSANTAATATTATSANTAATATTATSANITKTLDTTNGDKLQIGTGTAVNITNAQHAATADSATSATTATSANSATSATTATSATNANITKTTDTINGDKLQIGSGTYVNVTNAQHAATAEKANTYTGNVTTVSSASTKSCAVDNRFLVTANVTLTLGTTGSVNGCIAEVFAVSACTVSYAGTTLAMAAGTRATFIYYNGWKYYGMYGAVWN